MNWRSLCCDWTFDCGGSYWWLDTWSTEIVICARLRRSSGEAVKKHSITRRRDTVVPVLALPRNLPENCKSIELNTLSIVCYGHAGDGNLHINILEGELWLHFWNHNPELKPSKDFLRKSNEWSRYHFRRTRIGLATKEIMTIYLTHSNRLDEGN